MSAESPEGKVACYFFILYKMFTAAVVQHFESETVRQRRTFIAMNCSAWKSLA
jgi:hypothetical protein